MQPDTPHLACPQEFLSLPEKELAEKVQSLKKRLQSEITILGHHYQADPIVAMADFTGDSFKLCRDAANAPGDYIIFCGVRFMAESARVLARPDQVVIHPEESAGCPMADMADEAQVRYQWDLLTAAFPERRFVPVTYMNSSVEIKAFCGEKGGVVCTSSNAPRVFEWAWGKGDTILFFPDEHLGSNTAREMGVPPKNVLVWDPARAREQVQDPAFSEARVIVWKGFCHVHQFFTTEHVRAARERFPHGRIIVHPECPSDVVRQVDESGSTEYIIRRVAEADPGETLIIGTEVNLVFRLGQQHRDKTIVPLAPSTCHNMAKVTLGHLYWCLSNLGAAGVVEVPERMTADARKALDQMLAIP